MPDCVLSVAESRPCVKPYRAGRSDEYSCWYRVGAVGHDAVYWHPFCGLAREKDHSYLVELAALSGVVWEFSSRLVRDVYASGGLLLRAMGVAMQEAFIEDMRYAAECAADQAAGYEATRGVHVAAVEVF